jgi:preprotein translocase subunit SecD
MPESSSLRPGSRALTAAALALAAPLPSCSRATSHAQADVLQLLEVDDDDDPFAGAAATSPKGVAILSEPVPAGPDQKPVRHLARVARGDQESLADARGRLMAWVASVPIPAGVRVLTGPVFERDDKGRTAHAGWRTYLVRGTPIVDGADVIAAQAAPDSGGGAWRVDAELRPEGGERLRVYTAAHIRHRMAIVVDGVVESAPRIMTTIPSGKLAISMGAAEAEEQEREAKHLEGVLLGR